MKIKDNAAIGVNYQNKRVKRPILIENNFDNESSDDDVKKPAQKKKPSPELHFPSFLINATTFLEKECIFHLNKCIKLHQYDVILYFRDFEAKLAELANERDIEPVLLSSIAITSAKDMKHEDFIKIDVHKSIDFLD